MVLSSSWKTCHPGMAPGIGVGDPVVKDLSGHCSSCIDVDNAPTGIFGSSKSTRLQQNLDATQSIQNRNIRRQDTC